MIDAYLLAFEMVFTPYVLGVIFISGVYGLTVGSIPGLSATMAIALLVPITFFMPPVPAIAAIVTTAATAIFSGDIPGCLLRIPGTPASAAYVDESYQMNRNGQAGQALGVSLVFSVIGGIFGSLVLMFAAPSLAEFGLFFSTVEFFWLVVLGLGGAVFIGARRPVKAMITLLLGLAIGLVGMQNPAGMPRFTFGQTELLGGISLVPAMVGMFAVAEVIRAIAHGSASSAGRHAKQVGGVLTGMGRMLVTYPVQALRGTALGTVIGALPGAGADIAAWMSYAISKRFSKQPEKFGTGHPEGLVEASASNNSALGGTWIPALVFGIPGDSVTAIAIGVLYMKNIRPGPTIFLHTPENVYAIFLIFLLANVIMLPLGWATIKLARYVLQVPGNVLMPVILLFAMIGSYAINNSLFDVLIMLGFGIGAFVLEENEFPIAPIILGIVLGPMLEANFVATMVKSSGNFIGFVNRPVAAVLAALTFAIFAWTVGSAIMRMLRSRSETSKAGG